MKDRIPTYPGRVRLTPVSGEENTYDLERADQPTEVGTPINKSTLLSDPVAQALGLGDTAVPNDVFSLIAKNCWAKYSYNYGLNLVSLYEAGFEMDKYYGSYDTVAISGNASSTSSDVLYSDGININQTTGEVSLVNPNSTSIYTTSGAKSLKGKFFQFTNIKSGRVNSGFNTRDIYYMHSTVEAWEISAVSGISLIYVSMLGVAVCKMETQKQSPQNFVYDFDSSAFPSPAGIYAGYYYEDLGILFSKLLGMGKISIGSYTGTGAVGETASTSIEFPFAPKLFKLYGYTTPGDPLMKSWTENSSDFLLCDTLTTDYVYGLSPRGPSSLLNNAGGYAKKSSDGKTISWYHKSNATTQNNVKDYRYYWLAIG